jgi:hypothetical protein
MQIKTKQVLFILHIISWIVFIGLCIKTGTVIVSAFVSLFINPEAVKNLYMGLNLSSLQQFDEGHYIAVILMIIFLTALKAFIFYLVIKIFLTINLTNPFSTEISFLISGIGYVSLGIGVITVITNAYCEWLTKHGVIFPDLRDYLGGTAEFLLLGGVIFIISQVFKKGIEIQSENELTV